MKLLVRWKLLVLMILYTLGACTGKKEKQLNAKVETTSIQEQTNQNKVFCWTGTLNNKIPVFLHYSLQDKIIVGEITYLNQKEKKPVKVIGTLEEDTTYTILEFEPDGNNTGIITGKAQDQSFTGTLFSPETQNEHYLSLVKKDTVVQVPEVQPDLTKIDGNYHYQFSELGYQGYLKIDKLPDNQVSFSIFSVTEDPERHIAEVPTDTITMTGNSFHYKIPQADSCEFIVTFYNGFATVDYTNGYCQKQFGLDATVDGVFIKVK